MLENTKDVEITYLYHFFLFILHYFLAFEAYMAPEVFMKSDGSGHGRTADIWSVGCCIIEMASGRRPWSDFDSNYQIMFKVCKREHEV